MPHTSPINKKLNKHLLDKERFFRLLSSHCNYIDPDSAYMVYMGLVALIEEELRRNKLIRLPHLGDFALIRQKPKPAWVGKAHVVIDGREMLKFYPKEKMRRYFNRRQGDVTVLEILPPKPIE